MVTFEGGIGQALHFAYNHRGGGTQSSWLMVERMAKRKGDAERAEVQAEKAVSAQRINMQGLAALEVTAQAVLIRCAVDNLPPMQSRAIKARYCCGWEQTGAIGLLTPSLPIVSEKAALQNLLVFAAYKLVSVRKMASQTDTDRRVVTENLSVMRRHVHSAEVVALASLEPFFKKSGLV